MIDKYDDYPNGISESDIESATTFQLARIIEIYTQEFTEVIEEVIDVIFAPKATCARRFSDAFSQN